MPEHESIVNGRPDLFRLDYFAIQAMAKIAIGYVKEGLFEKYDVQ